MPRVQIAPPPQPHPFAGQNIAAFGKILRTLGESETLRRRKMMSSDILGILQGGGDPQKTITQNIAEVVQAHQQPQFDTGLQGLLQRIAAPFAQAPGAGITDALLKETVESAFQTISPSQQISQFRLQDINALKAKIGAGRGTAEDIAELKRLIGPTPAVQIGRMPWEMEPLTPEQRSEAGKAKAAAAKAAAEKALQLSSSDLNTARQSVKTLVSKMSHGTWAGDMWGFKNFKRNNLIAIYEQYRNENNYVDKSPRNRTRLDKIFDGQMKAFNQAGYGEHGTNEFDWDPKDSRVQELRKEQLEAAPAKKEPTGLEKTLEDRARNEIGRILQKMPKDISAETTERVMRGNRAGLTWQQMLDSDDLKPYREK